jgi:hypothetical protein
MDAKRVGSIRDRRCCGLLGRDETKGIFLVHSISNAGW